MQVFHDGVISDTEIRVSGVIPYVNHRSNFSPASDCFNEFAINGARFVVKRVVTITFVRAKPYHYVNYYARKQYENGQEKNEFMSSFINRVFLFDDKVIILYNTNKRETKRLNKKECLEIINGKNLEEIKENSFEPKKFKRVSSGCGGGI